MSRRRVSIGTLTLVCAALVAGAIAPPSSSALPRGQRMTSITTSVTLKVEAQLQTGERATLSGLVRPRVVRPLVLQRRSGGAWVGVRRFESASTGRFATTVVTRSLALRYRVVAPRVRMRQRAVSPVLTVADTTDPDDPTGLTFVVGAETASAHWNRVTTPDVVGYRAYHALRPTGPWNRVPDWMLDDRPGLQIPADPEIEHWIAVAAVDGAGNESARVVAKAVPEPAQPTLPVPDDVVVEGADPGRVYLGWSPVTSDGVITYRVFVATDPDGPWTETGSPTLGAGRTVTDLVGGQIYWFHVVTSDGAGNVSARSNVVSATPPRDYVAPPVPAEVVINAGNGAVALSWEHDVSPGGAEPRVGERIYEGPSAEGPWSEVPAERLDHYDLPGYATVLSVPNEVARWYKVTRVDAAGDESESESPLEATASARVSGEWIEVSTSDGHSCGIKSDHTLWCWGAGRQGELGLGDDRGRRFPAQVGTDANWASVSTSDRETCATKSNGTLWCAGSNFAVTAYSIRQIGRNSEYVAVASGSTHHCALRVTGRIHCWGQGPLGAAGATRLTFPEDEVYVGAGYSGWPSSFREVDLSGGNNCALTTDDEVFCWSNAAVTTTRGDWAAVDAGDHHVCGLKADSTLWCWGSNGSGQLGTGTTAPSANPVEVSPGTTWRDVGVAGATTCAIGWAGTLWCWGDNGYGQIDRGTLGDVLTPTPIHTDSAWLAGYPHGRGSCALRDDRTLWCWGYNSSRTAVGTAG